MLCPFSKIIVRSPLGTMNTPSLGLYNNLRNHKNADSFGALDTLVKYMTQWL